MPTTTSDHPVEGAGAMRPDRETDRQAVAIIVPARGMMISAMAMCHLLYVNRYAALEEEAENKARGVSIYSAYRVMRRIFCV